MKKIIAMLMVLAMAGSVAGCQTDTGTSDTSTGTDSTDSTSTDSSDDTAGDGTIDTSEFVTINYMVTGDVPSNQTDTVLAEINSIFKEKINAELAVTWIEWTDYVTKYNLALASQDGSIDLVGTATTWLDAWPNIQKGAFLALSEEMIQTYAPMTWDSVPAENWELCKYEGEIYLFPEDNYAQWTNHGFFYRGDWAEEAGLTDGVNSWDEMGEYLQFVKDDKGIVPWDATADKAQGITSGWQQSHTNNISVDGMPVTLFYGVSPEDPYTLSNYYLEGDELVEFATTMKEWNDAGYWREDVLNYEGDTRAQLQEGTTGVDQHHTKTWLGLRTTMEEKQPGSDLGFFWFGEETGNVVETNITHGAMAIAAQSDDPERALMMYDLMRNDEEIYHLLNYGIEGEQYIITEDGLRDQPEGFDSAVDGSGFNYWWGRNDDLEIPSARDDQEAYAEIQAQYAETSTQYQYGKVVFDLSSIQSQLDNLSNIYTTYIPQIAFGKAEDPVAYVEEFRQALISAGYEDCMAEIQSQIDAVYG